MNNVSHTYSEVKDKGGDIFKFEGHPGTRVFFILRIWEEGGVTKKELVSLNDGSLYSNDTEDPFKGNRDEYFSKLISKDKLTIQVQ